MKFEIKNRWTGEVQFTAEIKCNKNDERELMIGLAVKWAIENGANLTRANLYGANLDGANLDGANLTRANLYGANLTRANLTRANLDGANLDGANLTRANLYGANLYGANLTRANLDGANLDGANLDGAKNIGDFTMPDGMKFSQYLRDVVPALLISGGKTIKEIIEAGAWQCHSWENCPMKVALNISDESEAPPLLRARVKEFVKLFDAGLIPQPEFTEARSVAP